MKLLFLLVINTLWAPSLPDVTSQRVLYHSNKRSEVSTGIVTTDLNRILIKEKSKLEWQDGHGTVKYALDIKDVAGSLALDGSGQITYQVTSEKLNGRFTVKKTNDVITINAILISEGKPMVIEFGVSGYTVIN